MRYTDGVTIEILATLGWMVLNRAKGNPERAREIFNDLIPSFEGRYPHHKCLTALIEQTADPSPPPRTQIYATGNRLSAKLPDETIEVEASEAEHLANLLHAHGIALADLSFASSDDRESEILSATTSVTIMLRMRGLEGWEWRAKTG